MDTAGLTAEAPSAQPDSSLHCFLLILKDVDEGKDHGNPIFFSMAESYWRTAPRAPEFFEETVRGILDRFYELHRDEVFGEPWGELTELPAGSSLPLVLSTEDELRSFIEGHYGNTCCIGWIE